MIYFDNSATTPMLDDVIQTIQKVQKNYMGNPSSLHHLGVQAKALLEKARQQIAEILGVSCEEIFLTNGGTESNNTAILGTAFEKRGKHIITTQIEHPSVIETTKFLEKMGYTITYLPVNKDGVIAIEDLKSALCDETILVSIMWVNNEVGAIQPIKKVADCLENYPSVHFHVDAVQGLSQVLDCGIPERVDLLSLSAHKFHGPRSTGVLYKKSGRRIQPLLHGGGQEKGLKSGTEHVGNAAGMARALRVYRDYHLEKQQYFLMLSTRLRAFLQQFSGVSVLSPENGAAHIVTFTIHGIRGEVVVHALEDEAIYVSTTSACASKAQKEHHTLSAMKVPSEWSQGAVRISFSQYNTMDELQQFETVFNKVYAQFSQLIKN